MTAITVVPMIDAIHGNAASVPASAAKVAGYVTGSGGIAWLPGDWARFPRSGHVRIDQDPAARDPLGSDVLDVEYMAATPAECPGWVGTRLAHGLTGGTIYGTDSVLAACSAALTAAGLAGKADCWLADWNLNEAEAGALIGTDVHGLTVRAVQWASPGSDPSAIMPGSGLTLSQAQVDLSAADEAWHPAPGAPVPAPKPVPVPAPVPLPAGWQAAVMDRLPVLRQGASGTPVRRVQALAVAAGERIIIDGSYGPLTAAAIRVIQARAGLAADGTCGARTYAVLLTGQAL